MNALPLALFTVTAALPACAQQPTASQAPTAGAMHHEHAPAQPSTALTVQAGNRKVTLSVADLQAMPQTTVSVFNGHTQQNESYTGPLVSEVLARAGITLSEATQHAVLDSYVLAAGTDGYFVVFSGAELQPGLHKAQAIIAIAAAGQPLARSGAFQLIDGAEVKPARWVRNLSALTVVPVAGSR